jgi:WD40 repeat protein
MAQLFISYSRVDKDFVAELHDGLERLGHSAWVDWEGIPAASYFIEEILPAIDEAAGFLTVISPDYIKSEACRFELDHAIENSKRIIPLMFRTTDRATIPSPLGDIHWTFFDDASKFEERLKYLSETVNTDLGWMKEHARLLVRARHWDSRLRQSSLLLHGVDLRQAESWLREVHSGDERPTTLHLDFIRQSRQYATIWKRLRLAGLGVLGLFLLLGWGLYSRFESGQRLQQAQNLTSTANLVLPFDGGGRLSTLLATESLSLYPTSDGNQVLCSALASLPESTCRIDGEFLYDTDFSLSGDGQVLVISNENRINLYQVDSSVNIGSFDADASMICVNYDGTVVASCEGSGQNRNVIVRRLLSGNVIRRIDVSDNPKQMELDDLGSSLTILSDDGRMQQFDLVEAKPTVVQERVSVFQYVPGSSNPAYVQDATKLILPIANDENVELRHDSDVERIIFSTDNQLLTTTANKSLYVWDCPSGKVVEFVGRIDTGIAVLPSVDPRHFLVAKESGELETHDISNAEVVATSWLIDTPPFVDILGSRRVLAIPPSYEGVEIAMRARRIALKEFQSIEVFQLPNVDWNGAQRLSEKPFAEISFSGNGSLFGATAIGDGQLAVDVYDSRDGRRKASIPCDSFAIGAAISPNANELAISYEDGSIEVHDFVEGGRLARIDCKWAASAIRFAGPNRLLAACIDQRARIIDLRTEAIVNEFGISSNPKELNARISADGRWLLCGNKVSANVYDWDSGKRAGEFTTDNLVILAFAISGSGNRVVLADHDKLATIFDTHSQKVVASIRMERQFLEVALDSSGKQLAVVDRDGVFTVWNVDTADKITQRDMSAWMPNVMFTEIEFDPSGEQLLAASVGGLFRIGPIPSSSLLDLASQKLPCGWSLMEWNQYLQNKPFQPRIISPPLLEELQVLKQ